MVDRLSSPSTSGHAQSEQQSIASEAYWADVSDSGASSSDSRISNFSRTGPDYAPQPGTTQQIAVTSQPEPTPASNSTNVSTWKQIRISIPADPNRKTVLTYPIILDPPSRPTYSHNDPLPPKTGRSESSDWSSGRCDAAEAEMANRSAQGKIPGTAVKSGTTTTQAHDASKSPDGGSRYVSSACCATYPSGDADLRFHRPS